MILLRDRLKYFIARDEIVFKQIRADGTWGTDLSKIGPNSLDVTIAPTIRRAQSRYRQNGRIPIAYRPYEDPNIGVNTYWDQVESHQFIHLLPGETILAVTNEIVGSKTQFVPIFKQRSGLGRIGQNFMAGFGDVGYISRWTLEFTNTLDCEVVIPAGSKVGQIFFTRGEGITHPYQGSYGQGDWNPEDMLPKLHTDTKRDIYGWPVEENKTKNKRRVEKNESDVESFDVITIERNVFSSSDEAEAAVVESEYDEGDMSKEAIEHRLYRSREGAEPFKDGVDLDLERGLLDWYHAVEGAMIANSHLSRIRVEAELSLAIYANEIGTPRPPSIDRFSEYPFLEFRNLHWRVSPRDFSEWLSPSRFLERNVR